MIGFCKKWGKKEPVLVLSNLGDKQVVNFEIKFSEKCGNMNEKVIAVSFVCIIYLGNNFFKSFDKFQQTIFIA